jgi:hypothetical protein
LCPVTATAVFYPIALSLASSFRPLPVSADRVSMPRRQQRNRSSLPLSNNSDSSDGDSCFDDDGEPWGSGSDTSVTDADTDAEREDKMAVPCITQADKRLTTGILTQSGGGA